MKTFKDEQRIRHPKHGEGTIRFHADSYFIKFDDVETCWRRVGDEFYNQLEAVEDLSEVGEYAYFWNEGWNQAVYAKYGGINEGSAYRFRKYDSVTCYQNISKTPPKFD